MASLPHPLRPPKAKHTVRDHWRSRTHYGAKRFSGYAPIPFAAMVEIGRLTTGKATQLLYLVLAYTLGQKVSEGEGFAEVSQDFRTADIAQLAGCDERTVQREFTDLARRGVMEWEQPKKGVNRCRPLLKTWASLPDYTPGPLEEPEPEDPAAPDIEPEISAKAQGDTRVTREPVHVKAGQACKPIKLDCGVSALQLRTGDIDTRFQAVVSSGVLVVSLEQKWNAGKKSDRLLKPNGIQDKIRQGCRGTFAQSSPVGQSSKKRSKGETHPRAEELSRLFDDLLYRHSGKTLSADSVTLQKACEAAGAVPFAVLARDLAERSRRDVRLTHVVSIVSESRKNWEHGQKLRKSAESERMDRGHIPDSDPFNGDEKAREKWRASMLKPGKKRA